MDTVAHDPEAITDRQQEIRAFEERGRVAGAWRMIARHAQVVVSPLESSPSAP